MLKTKWKLKIKTSKRFETAGPGGRYMSVTKFLFQTDERKTEDRYEELFESYLYNQTQLLITFIILVLLIKLTM